MTETTQTAETAQSAEITETPGTEVSEIWWGQHPLRVGETGRFGIGPLTIWIDRRESEWQITTHCLDDRQSRRVECRCPGGEKDCPEDADRRRFIDHRVHDTIEIRPAMADRLLVAFAEDELHVMPGGRSVIYVSSPLWVQIFAGGQLLFEQAVVRPSDTWFGSSTRYGELAYGIQTPVTSEPEEQTILPFRAITRAEVENRADDELVLRRMALPAPNLNLYLDRSRPHLGLWTSGVTLERRRDVESAEVRIDTQPFDLAHSELVASPRHSQNRNLLVRALSSILT